MDSLWSRILPKFSIVNIADFRRPGAVNSRFAHWEPRELSLRWFKNYLLLAVLNQSDRQKEILGTIRNTRIGDPVTVRGGGHNVSLDYLLAAEEMSFIEQHFRPVSKFSVTEVGGGFGRTAHAFLALFPDCESYTIVDLSPVLEFARAYLATVLTPLEFQRIQFVDAVDFSPTSFEPSHIAIQIDGFQEFREQEISDYLAYFARCAFAFVSTPIGKYSASAAGLRDIDLDAQQVALQSGRLLNLVDPWDCDDLDRHRSAAVEAYRPPSMRVVASQASHLRPLYQHTLYRA